MEIIPAIDLRGGRCVRLYQGDYRQETVFSDDPVSMALEWQNQGAPRLHLVDLDGAARGKPYNLSIVSQIVQKVTIPVQLGGGIRRLETVEQLLEMKVGRVILGTAAVENPGFVEELCRRFGEAIVVSVDARNGIAATRGWQEITDITALDLVNRMTSLGVKRFIYTDISRDGTLTEPNFDAIAELVKTTTLPIIASGGIASIEHLQRLSRSGVEGAIIGQALYVRKVNLREAIAAFSR